MIIKSLKLLLVMSSWLDSKCSIGDRTKCGTQVSKKLQFMTKRCIADNITYDVWKLFLDGIRFCSLQFSIAVENTCFPKRRIFFESCKIVASWYLYLIVFHFQFSNRMANHLRWKFHLPEQEYVASRNLHITFRDF